MNKIQKKRIVIECVFYTVVLLALIIISFIFNIYQTPINTLTCYFGVLYPILFIVIEMSICSNSFELEDKEGCIYLNIKNDGFKKTPNFKIYLKEDNFTEYFKGKLYNSKLSLLNIEIPPLNRNEFFSIALIDLDDLKSIDKNELFNLSMGFYSEINKEIEFVYFKKFIYRKELCNEKS